jgi:PAS domain-containing protein
MKVVCSGCGIHLRDVPSKRFSDDVVSHGICETCAYHFMAQAGMSLPEYLEGLPAPVVIVTKDGRINSANRKAVELLGKTADQIQGQLGGDVFECKYAHLPGGCGKTEHCAGCAIRNTVMDTLQTGKSHRGVQAYLVQSDGSHSKKLCLTISAEKKGEIVFLSVDEIKPAA